MPKTPFTPENLPLKIERINQLSFISELIQANKKDRPVSSITSKH